MNTLVTAGLHIAASVPAPLTSMLTGRQPSVLMYHGVSRISPLQGVHFFDVEAFERQIIALKEKFQIVSTHQSDELSARFDKRRVIITFDDGLMNNAIQAAPILKKYNVPATFFVSTRHIGNRMLLWASYLYALEWGFKLPTLKFREYSFDMTLPNRIQSVAKLQDYLLALEPHPTAIYNAIEEELPPWEDFLEPEQAKDWVLGMDNSMIRNLAKDPLFTIGSHTVDHPGLTRCDEITITRQIKENKLKLEEICQTEINFIAYPHGDYNSQVITVCKKLGFHKGFAVMPKLKTNTNFEIPRTGIHRADTGVALFKAMWARQLVNRG